MLRFFFILIFCFTIQAGICQEGENPSEDQDNIDGGPDQMDECFKFDSIIFTGNRRTKLDYLQLHLDVVPNQVYCEDQVAFQVQSLERLNGLYFASYQIRKLRNKSGIYFILEVEIKEQRTLLPVLNFGMADGYNWFQLGLVDINVNGRGNELYGYYQNNEGRHAGQLFYKMPRIKGGPWGLSLNAMSWSSIEPLYFEGNRLFYDYRNDFISASSYYNFNERNTLEFSAAVFNEAYAKNERSINETLGPNALDLDKLLFKLEYQLDKLAYQDIYIKGYHWTNTYQYVFTRESSQHFNIFQTELKYFWKLGKKSNIATRLVLGTANNFDSPFSPFVIDSYKNIRAVGDRVLRGNSLSTVNMEYRYSILTNSQWAFQAVGFADLGAIRSPGSSLNNIFFDGQHQEFAGVGARIIYKKIFNAILRIDYGFDLKDTENRNFVLGLGQYF